MFKKKPDIFKVHRKFVRKYLSKKPYNEYIVGVAISHFNTVYNFRKKEIDVENIKNLEDKCLWVVFRELPPEDLFPKEYKGIKIYRELVKNQKVIMNF